MDVFLRNFGKTLSAIPKRDLFVILPVVSPLKKIVVVLKIKSCHLHLLISLWSMPILMSD